MTIHWQSTAEICLNAHSLKTLDFHYHAVLTI